MLRPNGQPKIYQQNQTWHARVYVPKSVRDLVGKNELHRSLQTSDKAVAKDKAVDERRLLYAWFNKLHNDSIKPITVVDELSSDLIAEIARTVYVDYHQEVMAEYTETINSPTSSGNASERDSVLRYMLDGLQPKDTAIMYADIELGRRSLSVQPGNSSYSKLVMRISDGLIQSHIDFVNNHCNTPGKDNNSYFVDPTTHEPINPNRTSLESNKHTYILSDLADEFITEISSNRGHKSLTKPKTTMALMCDYFGAEANVSGIDRSKIRAFRDGLQKLPSNATKRYPGTNMAEAITRRKPEHNVLSISSVNTHLSIVSQFFKTCSLNNPEYHPPNISGLKIDNPVSTKDRRKPFSAIQLDVFWRSEEMQREAAELSTFFWVSVVALYHGLRANEITGLAPGDIAHNSDIPCIDLKLPRTISTGQRNGRSKTIPRIIPLHPMLLKLGFYKYAAKQISREYLFPNLREDADGYRSGDISNRATKVIKSVGLAGQKLSFHSFRHNFADAADEAQMHEKTKAYLGGWALRGVMQQNYGSNKMNATILPAIQKISYGDIDELILDLAGTATS
ncbi:MAG: hypothetical protein COA52_18395 [Hyphomicrobiales bacterium]|nr:MAG: hypothetical protein COA52_18395 [Hyphomicrobiales bacterium]